MARRKPRLVFRVQDADGRGPWRPGFSHVWADDRPELELRRLDPIQVAFPRIRYKPGMHNGCACTSIKQLRRWFTENEYRTLLKLGFQAVRMKADFVIAENSAQVVFQRKRPNNVGVVAVELYPVSPCKLEKK